MATELALPCYRRVAACKHLVIAWDERRDRRPPMTEDFYCDEVLSGRTSVRIVRETESVLAYYRTRTHDRCESAEQAFAAARAFGEFQAQLADLDVDELRETIPGFFSPGHRIRQFRDALESDPRGRASSVEPEIRFALERAEMADVIEDALLAGHLPRRIVHGDTKLNNVLFDVESGRAACVVDLDTCMPAWSLFDFGDLVRFTAATSVEDETDLALAGTDLAIYRALVAGYLQGARRFLTRKEIELMPFAARLVTLTIGLRFLTDHLAGDVYFKTSRPEHNLDRARVQFHMVQQMEALAGRMAV